MSRTRPRGTGPLSLALGVLLLSACLSSITTTALRGSTGPPGAASTNGPAPESSLVAAAKPPGTIGPGDFDPADPDRPRRGHETQLSGYSVEEANRRARAAGFDGEIHVCELAELDASCKAGAVCGVDPVHWEGTGAKRLCLYVNRKIVITKPD